MPVTKILLVEDCECYSRLISSKLREKLGDSIAIDTAGSIRETIAAFTRSVYDLVILDLLLPDSGGLETLQSLKELSNDVPIIVLTGINDEKVKLQALAGGASAYVEKEGMGDTEISSLVVLVLWQARRINDFSKSISMRLDAIHAIIKSSIDEQTEFRESIGKLEYAVFGDSDHPDDGGLVGQMKDAIKFQKLWSRVGFIMLGGMMTLITSGIIIVATHVLTGE